MPPLTKQHLWRRQSGPFAGCSKDFGASHSWCSIDYGDGVQKKFRLPWKQDMAGFDAMNFAQADPHGLKFTYEGSTRDKYFLTQIDDVKNEGSGSGKRRLALIGDCDTCQGRLWCLQAQGSGQGFLEVFVVAQKKPIPTKGMSSPRRLTSALSKRKRTALLLLVLF